MFTCISQAPPCFQFTKKINNSNSEKIYLVVGGCLLVIGGCLLVVCSCLWSFAGGLSCCLLKYDLEHFQSTLKNSENKIQTLSFARMCTFPGTISEKLNSKFVINPKMGSKMHKNRISTKFHFLRSTWEFNNFKTCF